LYKISYSFPPTSLAYRQFLLFDFLIERTTNASVEVFSDAAIAAAITATNV